MRLLGRPNIDKLKARGNVTGLIKLLQKEELALLDRAYAGTALAEIGDPRAVDALIAALRRERERFAGRSVPGADVVESSVGLVTALIQALGAIEDPRAFEILLSIAEERENSELAAAAVEALVPIIDERTLPMLIRRLNEGTAAVRGTARAVLKRVKPGERELRERFPKTVDGKTVEELLEALGSPDPATRTAAASGLGKLGDPRAVPALIRALDDRYAEGGQYHVDYPVPEWYPVRSAALSALRLIGSATGVGPLAERLRSPYPATRRETVELLIHIARTVVPVPGGDVREQNQEVVNHVVPLLEDDDPPTEAVEVLAKVGDRSAVPALINAIERQEFATRTGLRLLEAVERLGGAAAEQFLSATAVPALIDAVNRKGVEAGAYVKILERIGGPEALVPLLKGDDPPTEAVEVLVKLGHRSAVPTLIDAIERQGFATRTDMRLLEALVSLGGAEAEQFLRETAVPALIDAVEREGSGAPLHLIKALEGFGGAETERFLSTYRQTHGSDDMRATVENLISAVRSSRSDRERLARKVESFGQEATMAIIALLGHEEHLVRWQAAQCLRRIGDTRAAPALAPLLDDPDTGVREAAEAALERIGGPEAERILASRRAD